MESIMEVLFDFFDSITSSREKTLKFFPFVFSFFIFILINNWLGLFPILGSLGFIAREGATSAFVPLFRSGTADINTTLALSIMIVLGSNFFGIAAIGIWKTFNKYVNLKALSEIATKVRKDPAVLIVAPVTFFVGLLELLGEFAKIFPPKRRRRDSKPNQRGHAMGRKTIEKDLKNLVAALKAEGIAVDKLFLFGSYARGKAVRGSDIDLLLISRSFSRTSLWDRAKVMGRIIRRHPQPFEVLMMTEKEFRASRFASEIAGQGLEIRV